jgi:hypothetical protein
MSLKDPRVTLAIYALFPDERIDDAVAAIRNSLRGKSIDLMS